ncbi:cupin domain-containing protein [Streptomyces olivoreticuli]|uniref:cupin domain-containing protein n=1 Tax=Streptomyces olivoreticuli TaxID=68246 RepID=UPI000E251D9A|nr:cupin domain-containing protein [Streptomyces olivoreticuli]
MEAIKVRDLAAALPGAWRSRVLGDVDGVAVKALRMDGLPLEEEVHDCAEVLFVVDGRLELDIRGTRLTVAAGELCVVPARTPHSVRPGSEGVLLIVESSR